MRCIELFQSYYWTIHFRADQIPHHHSRDRALQKNGRLLLKGARNNVIQFTNNSSTLIGFSFLFINMFECKLFIKMYPQMLLSWCGWTVELLNRRGEWYTLVIIRENDYLLSLFWWIWIEGHFPFIGPRTNLSWSLFSFYEVLIGSLTTENIEVSSAKSFTLVSRLSDYSLIYIKKKNGPKSWTLRHTRFGCQILVHSEQLFCCLSNKKDLIKVKRSTFTPIHFVL